LLRSGLRLRRIGRFCLLLRGRWGGEGGESDDLGSVDGLLWLEIDGTWRTVSCFFLTT
jgi:hypothetical protein